MRLCDCDKLETSRWWCFKFIIFFQNTVNILLLTQVLPYPPDSGPKIKTFNVIKYLSQYHDITLVSFVRGDQTEDVEQLKQYCGSVHTAPIGRTKFHDAWYMIRSLLTEVPFLMVRDNRRDMSALIDSLCAENSFDIVHADQLNMAQYAVRVPHALRVLDTHNALWLLYKRLCETMKPGLKKLLLRRDWQLLKSYEGQIVRTFDIVMAVTNQDKVALQEAAGQPLDIIVTPITVDTDAITVVKRDSNPTHILHMGTMYWPPNIDGVKWFATAVFPKIRQKRPDVQFDVVGMRPPEEIIELGKTAKGINVTGYVQDPLEYERRAAVTVIPVRAGGGMRVKILSALASGIPIVSTSLGCEGIHVIPGKHILVADTPDAFAESILQILSDEKVAKNLSENGRNLAQTTYDYKTALRPLGTLFAQLANRYGTP
jgi:glycosyltransferase involved in cell wall biosynthesis